MKKLLGIKPGNNMTAYNPKANLDAQTTERRVESKTPGFTQLDERAAIHLNRNMFCVDANCTPSDLVFGMPLRLPGQLLNMKKAKYFLTSLLNCKREWVNLCHPH